ncbi:DUF4270 domain-containing protein [Flavobacteriales bacterium]|nr:DUF4270 domain-containing protein [Flavobacteriales bacterium]MDG1396409.1 DUF4270 family protein [Flavobacteriales bacterium]
MVRISILFLLICLFSACKKNWNELGSQLIATENITVLSFDSLKIKASIHKEDSLSSLNTSSYFLGSFTDADFGSTDASIYTEFRMPSSDVVFGENAQADSIVLSFQIEGFYGDTSSALNISVKEMLEEITSSTTDSSGQDSSIVIYTDQDFLIDNTTIGSLSYTAASSGATLVNINLTNEFAQSFLDAETLNFEDNTAFQSFFKGLYISCDQFTSQGMLLELDLLDVSSKLTLYYQNSESDSLSYDFQINSNADKMTRWSHDYSTTNIPNLIGEEDLDQAYVQGSVGYRTYLTLPSLESLKDSNYVIHKAELTIPYIYNENDSVFSIPSKLGLAAVNSQGGLEILSEDQNIQGSSYFDGNSNTLDQTYTFNIARYVHKVIEQGYTNRLAIYVPSSVISPERVLISNDAVNSIKLKLFVSKQL